MTQIGKCSWAKAVPGAGLTSLVGLPDLTNKNTGHPVKFEFQTNNQLSLVSVCPKYCMGILTLKNNWLFI